MPEKTIFIVQHSERSDERRASVRQMIFKTAAEAQGRSEHDAARTARVALQQTIETDTGAVV